MPYQVPHNIDPNKIFLVNFSVLEKRWDPMYYTSLFVDNFKKISSSQYQQEKLSDLTSLISDGTHFTPTYTDSGIKFLSVKDVRKSDINFSDTKFISEEEAALLDTRCIPTKGDILLTKIGTIGYAAVIKSNERFQIFVSLALIRPKDNTLSKYLEIYLNSDYSYIQFKRCLKGAGVPDLHLEEIKNLIVVLPPLEKRNDIVSFYERAFIQQRKKLNESKQKLASIDVYLLNELGITLPEKDNSLEKRIFTVQFSEVCGGRLDPFWQNVQHEKMTSKKFQEFSVKSLATLQKGTSITSEEIIEGDYPVIAGGQTSPYSHNEYNFEGNVITISASGAYSGYVWYHEQPIFASDCTVLWSIDENKCLTIYIFEILRLKQQELYNLQQGAGQPHVYPQDIEKVLIPLPPLEKQREIVNTIATIRAEAKQLEQEGEEILKQARQQVEKMILGD